MTAKQLMLPAHRAFDSDGAPEAGATASLYLSGTLTPALFYSDSALSVSIGSTITANAAGRFDPMPYGDSAVAYRIIISDSEGLVLDDIDPFFFGLVTGVDGVHIPVKTRAELAAVSTLTSGDARYLSEGGREGVFVFSSANLSTFITADPNQGMYVAPASAPTGASGAWVRKFEGPLNPKWFGAIADDITDDSGAFTSAIAFLHATVTTGYGYGKGSHVLRAPSGTYYLGTTTLDMNHGFIFEGESAGGYAGSAATVLRWGAATTGIRTQRPNTTGATGDGVVNYGASDMIIRNLTLQGGFSATESEAHGIQIRCTTVIKDVLINGFPGDGIYSKANLGATGLGYLGSTSGSIIENVTCQGCRNGIYLKESDSNALLIINPLLSSNRRYGLYSENTLGSTIIGGVIATNGTVSGFPTMCSFGGNRYYCLPNQEVGAKANAPSGTTANNTYWGYFSAGGPVATMPAWVVNTTDFRSGGTMRLDSSFEQWAVIGVYREPDQPPAQIAATCQAVIVSPMFGNPVLFDGSSYGGVLHGNSNSLYTPTSFQVGLTGGSGYFARLGGSQVDDFGRFQNTAGNAWGISGAGGYIINDASAGTNPIFLTSPASGVTFGRSGTVGGAFMSQLMAIGYSNSGRIVDMNSAAPVSGNHAQGEIVWNNAPTAGGIWAWYCTVSGTPGTWVALTASSGTNTGDGAYAIQTKILGYTATETAGDIIVKCDLAAGFTVVLPTAVGNKARFTFKKIQAAGAIVIDGNASETIDGGLTATLNNQNESITIVSDNANWMII